MSSNSYKCITICIQVNKMLVWCYSECPKVAGSIPTVARHIFQACAVWIYTQGNITQASTNVLLFANGVHFNSLLKSKVSHRVYDNLVTFCIKFHVCPPWQYDRNRPGRYPGRTLPNNPFVNTPCIRGNIMISLFMHRFNYCQNLPDFIMITWNKVTNYRTIIREILPCYM
jgi:hypothetical protein